MVPGPSIHARAVFYRMALAAPFGRIVYDKIVSLEQGGPVAIEASHRRR
jgi:hypothetical protein